MSPRPRLLAAAILMSSIFLSPLMAAPTQLRMPAIPGATIAGDIKATSLTLGDEYLASHPRLVVSGDEIQSLKQKAAQNPELWKSVTNSAGQLAGYVPTGNQVREGYKYWRAEWMLSGALAYKLTGKSEYLENTLKWIKVHCDEEIWGVKYNSNHDLEASWNLYYISLAYDLLYDDMDADFRKAIAESLLGHCKAIYDAKSTTGHLTYDQNHMYIPITALTTGALALADDYPQQTTKWLNFCTAMMNRCRYVLGNDGYYYEGTSYWLYAMHWHVRYADMMTRACGGEKNFFDLDVLKKNYHYARQTYLSDSPFAYDIGDSGNGPIKRATDRRGAWIAMLYCMGKYTNQPDCAAVADKLREGAANDDPAMSFLWYWQPPKDKRVNFDDAPTSYYFEDHGVVCWRSSWDDDATCYMFKAGPPQGHAATAKLEQLKDWKMNSGHVHPDIGMFWIFADGSPICMDSGYLGKKYTDDHSTLLVDDKGMGSDGSYWAYRGKPYKNFDAVRILTCDLKESYGYVAADIGAAWQVNFDDKLRMVRHVLMTAQCMIVIDELSGEKPHSWSFLANTESDDFSKETSVSGWGNFVQAGQSSSCVRLYPISPGSQHSELSYGPNTVLFGRGPGQETPTETGGQIRIKTDKMTDCRFVVMLVPDKPMNIPPRTKVLRNDDSAFEIQFNDDTFAIDLKNRRAYFDPPRDN